MVVIIVENSSLVSIGPRTNAAGRHDAALLSSEMPANERVDPKRRNSDARRNLVSQEILENAAALFARRGFASTSLQEVADSLGLSRSALYHYIGGKDELLSEVIKGLPGQTAARMKQIRARTDLTPLEQISEVIADLAQRVAGSPARFRLLLLSQGDLSPSMRSTLQRTRRTILEELTAMIDAGVRAGEIRPVDPELAAFGLLGMCNWIATWYRPDMPDGHSPDEVAKEFCEIAVAGLKSDPERRPTAAGGPQHALRLLREDLEYLERSLETEG